MNGMAWEVRGLDWVPPVSINLSRSNGADQWFNGTFWVFVDGGWVILEP